jgi:hypothetical protein
VAPAPRSSPRPDFRRRRLIALGGVVVVVGLAVWGVSAFSAHESSPAPIRHAFETAATGAGTKVTASGHPVKKVLPQLPGGGRTLFPAKRIVAYYGNPRAAGLGTLGIGSPSAAVKRLERAAKPYARKTRPVLPALELISTVADADPGSSGEYRTHMPSSMIDTYLKAARKAHALLILDIQPGRASFVTEAKRLEKYLVMPDVGLALDPEWRVTDGQVPGKIIGGVDVSEVDQVSAWLAGLVKQHDLPEKVFLIHRFTDDMLRGPEPPAVRPGLATVINVDGFGTPSAKVSKYKAYATNLAPGLHRGFKLFYHEDTDTMSPKSVMALNPRPDVIVYE